MSGRPSKLGDLEGGCLVGLGEMEPGKLCLDTARVWSQSMGSIGHGYYTIS